MATTLLNAATATGASQALSLRDGDKAFQVYGTTSAGAGAATIDVEVSNDGTRWDTVATLTLTLSTTEDVESWSMDAFWAYARYYVTAISGTDATVYGTVA